MALLLTSASSAAAGQAEIKQASVGSFAMSVSTAVTTGLWYLLFGNGGERTSTQLQDSAGKVDTNKVLQHKTAIYSVL